MKLYIRVENGQPIDHPAFEDNLIEAFGLIPDGWKPFVRVERPVLGKYEKLESEVPKYQFVDGVWRDVWSVRPMTSEEKEIVDQQHINAIKQAWAARFQAENWSSWVFNEQKLEYEPPIPRPPKDQEKLNNNIYTFWCGAENNWKDTQPYPQDGKLYRFDFFAWKWIEVI